MHVVFCASKVNASLPTFLKVCPGLLPSTALTLMVPLLAMADVLYASAMLLSQRAASSQFHADVEVSIDVSERSEDPL